MRASLLPPSLPPLLPFFPSPFSSPSLPPSLPQPFSVFLTLLSLFLAPFGPGINLQVNGTAPRTWAKGGGWLRRRTSRERGRREGGGYSEGPSPSTDRLTRSNSTRRGKGNEREGGTEKEMGAKPFCARLVRGRSLPSGRT